MDFRSLVETIPTVGPLTFWKAGLTAGYNLTGPADTRTAYGKISISPGDVVARATDYTAQGAVANLEDAAGAAADWISETAASLTGAAGRTAGGLVSAAIWLSATAAGLYILHKRGYL